MTDINAALDAWIAERIQATDSAVQQAGQDTENDAKQRCPVGKDRPGHKGGQLKSSIQYKNVGKAECTIGTTVEYAPYVELGTSKMAPQPYLFPAFVKSKSHLIDELINIWSN
jgi:HK97 gp10 family phage protein